MKRLLPCALAIAMLISVALVPSSLAATTDTTTKASEPWDGTASPSPSASAKPVATPKPVASVAPTTAASVAPTSSVAPSVAPAVTLPGTESYNAAGQLVYTVAKNDWLSKIAIKYGVTYQEIAKANKIKNVNVIIVGQQLIIPGHVIDVTTPVVSPTPAVSPDVTTKASPRETKDATALVAQMATNTSWICSITADVTVPTGTVINVNGNTWNKDDKTKAIDRKLALYAQDDAHKVTAEYKLTADRMNVNSPNFRIVNGTFVGDIYVNEFNFKLEANAKVIGNVYFVEKSQMDSAINVTSANVTGTIGISPEVDATTAASARESKDAAVLLANMATNTSWIYSITNDVVVPTGTVIEVNGVTRYRDIATSTTIDRKLALYSQTSARVVTKNYKLTADRMNVNSPNFRIVNGEFIGDIYVNEFNFKLEANAKVTGNVYFAKKGQMDSAINVTSANVSGTIGMSPEVDAMSGASPRESKDSAVLLANMATNTSWIYSITNDVVVPTGTVIEVNGITRKGDIATSTTIDRKLALYSQNSSRLVTKNYKLTADRMNVNSPNFRIVNGEFIGDIYVNENNFTLDNFAKVTGNVYFTKKSQMDSAVNVTSANVSGKIALSPEVDATTAASAREDKSPETLLANMATNTSWIYSITNNVVVPAGTNIVVNGITHAKDNAATTTTDRKLALYSQGAGRVTTKMYTLTADKMIVNSPNFRVVNGKFVGDIYVTVEGFKLDGSTVTGNVYFATQALLDAANASGNVIAAKVTGGTISVKALS